MVSLTWEGKGGRNSSTGKAPQKAPGSAGKPALSPGAHAVPSSSVPLLTTQVSPAPPTPRFPCTPVNSPEFPGQVLFNWTPDPLEALPGADSHPPFVAWQLPFFTPLSYGFFFCYPACPQAF